MADHLPDISPMPPAPTRQSPVDFDTKTDAFLSALVVLSTELDAWTGALNDLSDEYNEKFYNRDSRLAVAEAELEEARGDKESLRERIEAGEDALDARTTALTDALDTRTTALEVETSAARGGEASIADRINALNARLDELILDQHVISLGEITVTAYRGPLPDDDGYVVGTYWISTGADDFWVCTKSATRHARWRRSNGELVRRLNTPTISGVSEAGEGEYLTLTLSGLDPDAEEVRWTVTGSPVVADGALEGSLGTSITLMWETPGHYTVRASVRSSSPVLHPSFDSNNISILVGPAIYCGCGIYPGDNIYPSQKLD